MYRVDPLVEVRQQWQQSAPAGQQPGYSQGNPDDFSEIDDTDDLPF